ncbi:hypothetical protein HX89_14585 (plasmid) [Dermacoccus nishinomiyaensis]|uniref:DUF3558 domain-containing protein n=1 Tax=Dermacoccus nishinomiyaensis TaxID=1274 RepID=A0A075JP26_9MICO|nr:hypothetical protein [Dermacoccus nishinomiyaensis]AIF41918.1 hypothetical protein HX89_14585 [Dermacoccus nishinomiyaensis]
MRRRLALLAALPLALTACSTSTHSNPAKTVTVSATPSSTTASQSSATDSGATAPSQDASSATVIDPKTLVAKIPGCKLDASATVEYDVQGSQYIDCTIDPDSPNSIAVTVRTNTHTPGRMAGHVTPAMQYVTGPTWLVQMQASTPTWPITPQKVAQILGGTVPKSDADLPE